MTSQRPGWGALLGGRNGLRSLALAGGVALHAINVYVATTILPSVVADIGGLDYYAWNTTLFVVASIIGSALSAKLLRAAGPRGAYLWSALFFGVGTLACAIAPNMPVMLLGRLVQGFGGGFLMALSYAMIRIVFPESLWPRGIALVSGMWGVATLVGPAIGGIFAELGAWRAAFWSIIPAVVLFALLALLALPGKSSDQGKPSSLPFAQLVLLTLAVLAVSFGSVQPGVGWNIAGVVAALLLIAFLVGVERRAGQRLLPRGSLSLAAPLGLLFATISLLAITVASTEIFVPLSLQVLHQQSPLAAGYLAAMMAAGWTIGSIASSGARGGSVGGILIVAPMISLTGMIMLALLMPSPSGGTFAALTPICVALVIVGLGVGLCWPHLLTRILQIAPKGEQDLASAAITTVQLFAIALGAALAGMVVNLTGLTEPGGIGGTARASLWLFAIFASAPAIGLLTALRSRRLRPIAGAQLGT